MSDSRFSGGPPSGQPGGDDRFGYFGAAAPSGGGSSQFGGSGPTTSPPAGPPSPFGGAPAAPANPFGGAPAAPANPFGAPPGPQAPFGTGVPTYGPPPGASSGSKAKPIVIGLVALAVLGAGWFGYHTYQRSRPVTLPASVAGLPLTTEPTVVSAVHNAQTQLQDQNPGMKLQVQAYGSATARIVIAAAGRGRTNVSDDFAAFGNDIGGTTQVGSNTCATSPASHIAVCERTNGDLTVMVAEVAKATAPTEAEVAGMVDEIWNQL